MGRWAAGGVDSSEQVGHARKDQSRNVGETAGPVIVSFSTAATIQLSGNKTLPPLLAYFGEQAAPHAEGVGEKRKK